MHLNQTFSLWEFEHKIPGQCRCGKNGIQIDKNSKAVTRSKETEIREKREKLVRRKRWLETGRGEEAIKVNMYLAPLGHVYALQGRSFSGPSLGTEITPNVSLSPAAPKSRQKH